MATHVVCKPLPSADGLLPSGTQVDASDWPHTPRLVTMRYLRPLRADEQDEQPDAPPRRQRGREVPPHAN